MKTYTRKHEAKKGVIVALSVPASLLLLSVFANIAGI